MLCQTFELVEEHERKQNSLELQLFAICHMLIWPVFSLLLGKPRAEEHITSDYPGVGRPAWWETIGKSALDRNWRGSTTYKRGRAAPRPSCLN
jgi:hypothetical protein